MHNYLTPNFSFAPMIPERALGSRVWDTEGREYVDLSGGIAVNALGHSNPVLIEALSEQANKLWHISNIYTTGPAQELAQKLVEHSFGDKVFFCNSGAEANEAALKLARKYGRDRSNGEKNEIVACLNSFHGRTVFTVSVGGQPKYSQDYAPLPQGITHVPFNDIAALEATVGEKTCAVIIEPIQGESGILPATQEYLETARRLCDQHGALLVFDEVQTGMGHTGKLFAYEHYGIVPDIMSLAKALGCGFPIGAIVTTDTIAPTFGPGTHGSTFGGNPMACAVGSRAFDIINAPETLAHVVAQGEKLRRALESIGQETGVFKQVRGMGLLLGAVLSDEYQGRAGEIMSAALKHGLMVLVAGSNVVRFAPSLLLSDEDLEEGLGRLKTALNEWLAQAE
ncbi:acetylornithine/succinyldiaminopimelate transaminase [Neisseria perflava]|uniref:acetylornithine/succinyldiaminopimelate transaminase n=1 Tax=Neisseria perflava TaxID=33053 RepID=UPI0020A1337D|nr:acetylornithine/succinyldiaminopimelate transaminase [Neisseria perflava]MCP1660237.1 acetylornithine/N-succinyldiaminopimelate aminotransferase [Neisseria perflava]MCP1771847.1 acetylornithine/N-succinyldiaminopimelate aminotransferase [Neisseria perflava]